MCTCVNGWAGSNCDIRMLGIYSVQSINICVKKAICSQSCGTNQECTSPNTCTCESGWTGLSCSKGICTKICIMHIMSDYPGIPAAICNSCNGINQQCLIPGVCTCVEGWTGPKCEIGMLIETMICMQFEYSCLTFSTVICAQSCGTNKECSSPDTCTCVSGWTGADCLTGINPHDFFNTRQSCHCSYLQLTLWYQPGMFVSKHMYLCGGMERNKLLDRLSSMTSTLQYKNMKLTIFLSL